MHLNAALGLVPSHNVLESRKVEIGAELAVHTREQIFVERSGHSRWIVVSKEQLRNGLFEVGRKKQGIAWPENFANLPQEALARGPIEIPDGAAKKENEQRFVLRSTRSYLAETFQIGAFESNDADHLYLAQLRLASMQRRLRNVDRVIIHALAARESFKKPARLLSRSAAQLCR